MYVQANVVWAISNVLYYDSAERMLRRGDIEILDSEIVGVTSPGTSSATELVDGSGFVCMPGLVNGNLTIGVKPEDGSGNAASVSSGGGRAARLGDILFEAVSSGVTTVGLFSSRVEEDLAVIARIGVRTSLYRAYMDLWLGPEPKPVVRDVAACLCDYANTARRFESTMLMIQPAVASQLAGSTRLLTALHDRARIANRRLVVRVDEGAPWMNSFRDAYGCSGLGLLSGLDILDENTLIVPNAPMSFVDRERFRRCNSHVVHQAAELGAQTGRRANIARADITSRLLASLGWGRGAPPCTVEIKDSARNEFAGEVIDLLTWKGAHALTFPETGKLARGKRADLLLYDGRLIVGNRSSTADCAAILKMICRRKPRGVLINGGWVIGGIPKLQTGLPLMHSNRQVCVPSRENSDSSFDVDHSSAPSKSTSCMIPS